MSVPSIKLNRREEESPRCWRVRCPNGSIRGPYAENHIADLLAYKNLSAEVEVAAIDSDDWYPLKKHPAFTAWFEGKSKWTLSQSQAEENSQDQEEVIDVHDILKENLRIAQRHAVERETVGIVETVRVLSGIIAYMLLFGFAGVVAAYFIFEQASTSIYVLVAMGGAFAGLLYARCQTGSLSHWK